MSDNPSILDKFRDAIDIEDNVRVTLTKVTPKENVPATENVLLRTGIIIDSEHYFTASEIEVPFKGIIMEAIPLERRSSKAVLSQCSVLPKDLFPLVPDEFEVGFTRNQKVPLTSVTLPNGQTFYVCETVEEIRELADKDREVRVEQAAQPITEGLKAAFGL